MASTQGTLHAAIPFTVAHSQSHSFVPSGDAVGSAIQPPQATAPPAQQHMHDAGLAMPQSTAASQPYRQPHRRYGRPARVLRHADAAASCAEGCRSFTTWIVCDPPAADLGPHADPSCCAGATAATVYGEPTGSGVSSRVAEHADVAPQIGRIAARYKVSLTCGQVAAVARCGISPGPPQKPDEPRAGREAQRHVRGIEVVPRLYFAPLVDLVLFG